MSWWLCWVDRLRPATGVPLLTAWAVGGSLGRVVRPELVMTLPRPVAEVLSEHAVFEVECIGQVRDRLSSGREQA